MWKGIIADYKGENPVGIVKSSGYLIYITAYLQAFRKLSLRNCTSLDFSSVCRQDAEKRAGGAAQLVSLGWEVGEDTFLILILIIGYVRKKWVWLESHNG